MKKNKDNSETEEFDDDELLTTPVEEDSQEEKAVSVEELKTENEKLKADNEKLHEDFLRAYADAENTKRRCAQEIEKNSKYAISAFAKDSYPFKKSKMLRFIFI